MDDSIGTPAHLPPVPKGTAFLTMGGDQGVAITPHEAATVFMGLWSMREDAMQASSLSELKQVEDGVALASDTNALTCRCIVFRAAKAQELSVIVPRTVTYPAHFVAEMAADSGGLGVLYVMVVKRANPSTSWHVTLDSGFATKDSMVGQLDASGWAGDAGEPTGSDGHGFAELAALWQRAKVTGKSGDAGAFDASSWLVSDELDFLAKYPQGTPQANGLRGTVTFAKDTAVPLYGVEASSEDIVCGAIRETDTYTPAPGYAISQDAERHAFGAALQPGLYRSVTQTREWQVCIFGLADSPPVPIAWDPTYHAAVSGVPVPKGEHVLPDPAQHPEMPSDDGSGGSGSSASPGGSDGSNT